jgi:hypothetical protein
VFYSAFSWLYSDYLELFLAPQKIARIRGLATRQRIECRFIKDHQLAKDLFSGSDPLPAWP